MRNLIISAHSDRVYLARYPLLKHTTIRFCFVYCTLQCLFLYWKLNLSPLFKWYIYLKNSWTHFTTDKLAFDSITCMKTKTISFSFQKRFFFPTLLKNYEIHLNMETEWAFSMIKWIKTFLWSIYTVQTYVKLLANQSKVRFCIRIYLYKQIILNL